MKLALRVFFRKVYLSGAPQIDRAGPVILPCNHPNSFLDAVLLAVLLPRPLHFLARSDVFDRPWKRWLLSRLHLVPVYRQEEGSGHLHRNEETFRRCTEILAKGGAVLVFSEGICVLEKRLRALRKGTARLAFFAEASCDFKLGLQVIPIGLNYTYADSFRGEVMIGVGQPFSVQPWRELYQQNPARAMLAFNQVLGYELEKNIISFPSKEQELAAEKRLRSNRAVDPGYLSRRWYSDSNTLLRAEQEIAGNTGETDYSPTLAPAGQAASGAGKSGFLPRSPVLWFAMPLLLPGLLLNGLPLLLSWWLTVKTVKRREFYASVLLAAGFFIFPFYWLGVFFWGVLHWGWIGFVCSLLVPVSAYPALRWLDAYRLEKL
ncbi:MAG: 1-acyl-sn-glycerol-3-phosphate acyltransferase [Adhaeribacter sp.]